MNTLPNDGLYITRKRKKWKFAHFDSYTNCFTHPRGSDGKNTFNTIRSYFSNSEYKNRKMIIELAAGNAQFSFELAKRHPDCDFVAIDIKSDRLYTSAKQALLEGVQNIAFLRMGIDELAAVFPDNTVDEIWLTFPDPFPKDRSAKHRLSHSSFLRQYCSILKEAGILKFKTDNRELFLWSLEQLVAEKWYISELSFDLHESDLLEDYKIKTYYEQKFTSRGIPTNYTTCSVPTLNIT